MKMPVWLMTAALLFWGWETGMWVWGILMAAALGASRMVKARWEFSDADLNRICDLCWMLFIAAGIMLYSTEDRLVFIFKFTQWLPVIFFFIMAAQAYGNREKMPLRVFSWFLRRTPQSPLARKSFNISYPYFVICMTAASASTRPNIFFYTGMSIIILLALMMVRPRRSSLAAWVALAAIVAGMGYLSHKQLRQMQNAMEGALGGWLADFFRPPPDSRECRTLIGSSRPIPQSGRIVLRLKVPPSELCPSLLRESAYDAYKNETWWASSNDLGSLCGSGSNDIVKFFPEKGIASEVEIARYYEDGEGTLALPHGTYQIDNLAALFRTNRLGVAVMDAGPSFVDLFAHYSTGSSLDSAPGPLDLGVPDAERPALRRIAAQLHLNSMTARQKVRAVETFFRDNFTYSLDSAARHRKAESATWLSWFLEDSHSGHCEYFATATVLLLRQAGVYARYVTGYAVPESARHGDTYLIRERHAHAWALVYRGDGVWEQVDTTPSDWDAGEDARPSWWEPTSDFVSNVFFQFSKWRWGKTSFARDAEWLLAPLIVYLLWRILTTQRRQRVVEETGADEPRRDWPGLDSELYLISERLAPAHLARRPEESLRQWEERLEEAFPESAALRRIFELHRRLRFDPRGLHEEDRRRLCHEARAWLDAYSPGPPVAS